MKKIFLLIALSVLILNPANLIAPASAQIDISTSSEDTSPVTIDTVLADIDDLVERIKTNNKKDKSSAKTIRTLLSLERRLDKSVKLTPPSKCHEIFTATVKDFYSLVSKLGSNIACGPPIIPPFDLKPAAAKSVEPDCLPPESLHSQIRVNLFSETYGIYEKLRGLYNDDLNENGITDVCE